MEPGARQRSGNAVRRRRHYRYALAVSLLFVLTQYVNVLPIFRDRLQSYLAVSGGHMALIFGIGPLAGALAVLAAGPMLNRVGPVRMIRLALLGQAAGMILVAACGGRWLPVLLGAAVCGLFAGPLAIAMSAYLTGLFPRDRRKILSLGLAVVGIGGITVPLAAELLLKLSAGAAGPSFGLALRGPFLALGTVLALASLGYRSRRAAAGRRVGPSRPWTGRQFLLPLPALWLVGLMALHGGADNAIYTWMPRFLDSGGFASHPLVPGLVLAAMALAYLVSRSLLAFVPEAWGRRALLVLPGLLGGGAFLAGVLSRSFWLTAGGYVLGAFLWSAEYPTMLGTLAGCGKRHFGPALALAQVLTGLLTSALVFGAGRSIGWLGDGNSWPVMAVLAGGFLLVGSGGGLWLARRGRGGGREQDGLVEQARDGCCGGRRADDRGHGDRSQGGRAGRGEGQHGEVQFRHLQAARPVHRLADGGPHRRRRTPGRLLGRPSGARLPLRQDPAGSER